MKQLLLLICLSTLPSLCLANSYALGLDSRCHEYSDSGRDEGGVPDYKCVGNPYRLGSDQKCHVFAPGYDGTPEDLGVTALDDCGQDHYHLASDNECHLYSQSGRDKGLIQSIYCNSTEPSQDLNGAVAISQ